ncbi:MAG: hypothetical protein U0587_12820 [Candidatus Binatia bacterium]
MRFLELVRYHLIGARLVTSVAEPGHLPVEWPRATGRAGERRLAGRGESWGDSGAGPGRARQAYRAFVAGFCKARRELTMGRARRDRWGWATPKLVRGAGALGL